MYLTNLLMNKDCKLNIALRIMNSSVCFDTHLLLERSPCGVDSPQQRHREHEDDWTKHRDGWTHRQVLSAGRPRAALYQSAWRLRIHNYIFLI